MSESRRQFALHLALTPGIGGRTLLRILARADLQGHSADAFFRLTEEELREHYGLRVKAARAIAGGQSRRGREARELEAFLFKHDVKLITAADPQFPQGLEQLDPDPATMLFLYGNTRLLDASTFCVLSSRRSPTKALDQIERLAEEGVLSSEVLVAGHNSPEYQRAAVVPLRWGSPRVLCLDRGFFHALGEGLDEEPFAAARLWRYKFDPEIDLAVSPFRPTAKFAPANNRVRDRIVAGLSNRLDFVYVNSAGNMDQIARRALGAGRPVRVSELTPSAQKYGSLGAEILGADKP